MIPAEQPLEENRFTRFAKARLDSFLSARPVLTAVQPMVDLESSDLVGHELLARPRNTDGSQTARSLLKIAESQGLAAELSRRLRAEGLAKTAHRVVPGRLFLNTHPAELERPQTLVASLRELVETYPDLELTVEIHEQAPLDLNAYVELRHQLRSLGIGVAFDDFGTGHSRLLELAAAPPDYVKFARRMVTGIDQQVRFRKRVLLRVIEFIHEIGALPIAVGVETAGELAACRALGFTWAQGFLVGRPWTVAV
jgi:EAL domain-containing protein (putative c-di-GMP-specific phosphodiesterase class I)